MRERIRAFTRAFQRRNGWHKVGLAVGIVIVGFALLTLFRLLRDIEVDKVVTALRLTSPQQMLAAAGFVAASYVTLTFYDWFSLRTVGRGDVPYRVAAMASFTSYTIGHNLGAHRLHRQRHPVSNLFRLGSLCSRCRQDRVRHRSDVLAGQCVRPRLRV